MTRSADLRGRGRFSQTFTEEETVQKGQTWQIKYFIMEEFIQWRAESVPR